MQVVLPQQCLNFLPDPQGQPSMPIHIQRPHAVGANVAGDRPSA
jgi:hypothetical protein